MCDLGLLIPRTVAVSGAPTNLVFVFRRTAALADPSISSIPNLRFDIFDHLDGVLQLRPKKGQRLGDFLWRVAADVLGDGLGHVVFDVHDHDAPPPLKPTTTDAGCMTRKRGVSFDDHTFERLERVAGDGSLSKVVDRYCWRGLEEDRELAKRGITIEDPAERTEFVLDILTDALDEWNA